MRACRGPRLCERDRRVRGEEREREREKREMEVRREKGEKKEILVT